MVHAEAIALLRTRSEVRGYLAKEVEALIGTPGQPELPAELEGLATGSDREVVQASMRLDKSFGTRSVAGAASANAALGRRVRDLFSKALQRMKELPPDPREILHANPAAVAVATKPVKRRG